MAADNFVHGPVCTEEMYLYATLDLTTHETQNPTTKTAGDLYPFLASKHHWPSAILTLLDHVDIIAQRLGGPAAVRRSILARGAATIVEVVIHLGVELLLRLTRATARPLWPL